MRYPTERTAHTTSFVTPVVNHWLEREIARHSRSQTGQQVPCGLSRVCVPFQNHLQLLGCKLWLSHKNVPGEIISIFIKVSSQTSVSRKAGQ